MNRSLPHTNDLEICCKFPLLSFIIVLHFNDLIPILTSVGRVEFVADDKDLESDEALWALYERWCKAFNEKREPLEMSRRFSKFKETVLMVDSTNKANLPYKLGINRFADGKNAAFVRPAFFRVNRVKRIPIGISRTFRGAASEFEKEP